jgi:hypothetical protein
MTSKSASCIYLQVRIICDIWRNEVSPLFEQVASAFEEEKKRKTDTTAILALA